MDERALTHIVREVVREMRGRAGSVTLHFDDSGRVRKTEYRYFTDQDHLYEVKATG